METIAESLPDCDLLDGGSPRNDPALSTARLFDGPFLPGGCEATELETEI